MSEELPNRPESIAEIDFDTEIYADEINNKGEHRVDIRCPFCQWSHTVYEPRYQPEGFVAPRRLAMESHWGSCKKLPKLKT